MTKVVLDSNVWDKLALSTEAQNRILSLCNDRRMEILVPDTLHQELMSSPFKGIPDWFPIRIITDSVFVLNQSWLNHARLGEGKVYKQHLGESSQRKDAIIVDTTDTDADFFVSEDIRARTRYAALRGSEKSMNFREFCKRFLGLEIKVAGPNEVKPRIFCELS